MPIKHTILALIIGISILFLAIELVRRRKLLEDYSVLWILTGIILLISAANINFLRWVTRILDMQITPLAIFLFGIVFLILVCLQFSIKLTEHTHKLKNISQEIALLKQKLESSKGNGSDTKPVNNAKE